MDAAKKTAIEKRLVIGLAGVFVIALCAGPLRNLGWFARKAPAGGATPTAERLSASQPPGVMMPQPQSGGDQEATAPVYTAQHLRDPLESLLPKPAEPPAWQAPAADAQPTPSFAPTISESGPPPLDVQGLLWGQAEPKAIIGNRVYGIGDQVEGGWTVVGIDHRGIVLDYQGQRVSYQSSSMTPSVVSGPHHSGGSNHGR